MVDEDCDILYSSYQYYVFQDQSELLSPFFLLHSKHDSSRKIPCLTVSIYQQPRRFQHASDPVRDRFRNVSRYEHPEPSYLLYPGDTQGMPADLHNKRESMNNHPLQQPCMGHTSQMCRGQGNA